MIAAIGIFFLAILIGIAFLAVLFWLYFRMRKRK